MAGAGKEKKQQALTNFFTPQSVNGLNAIWKAQQSQTPEGSSSKKRSLEPASDDENETPTKRTKPSTVAVQATSPSATKSDTKSTAKPTAARTERYIYDESASQNYVRTEDDGDDAAEKKRKADLHAKFVKKLGRPDSLKGRAWQTSDEQTNPEEAEDAEEDEEEQRPAPKVGYKFRFFGEDARIAAKELSIVCIPGKMRYDEHPSEAHLDRFASASIPVPRLPVHAKRLVAAGHKVGVIRQIETAALKKVGDNRNAPFAKGGGTDEKVDVGIIAVQPATGDIIYDSFEDGFMRSEIETRLLHISPCEFLIVGELTKGTDKLVKHLSSGTNVFGDRSRVEKLPKSKTAAAEAYSHVTQFYADKLKESEDNEHASSLLDKVLKLPEPVTICLSSMINHLKEYGLEHIFDLTKYFQSFSTRSHMLINGTTLESLEVYRNQTDQAEKGSLFWALDKTLTRTDLERSLIRIYYGKCTRPELLAVLQTLQRIAVQYSQQRSTTDFASPAISKAMASLPAILPSVLSYLDRINAEAARKDDKYSFFRETEETDAITDHKLGIASVEQELDAHCQPAAQKVPASWIKISGTKKLSRFHTPEVVRLVSERDQHKEALAAACDAAFAELLSTVASDYQPLRDAVSGLATLDCLLSLSKVAALPGYTKPTFLPSDSPPAISVQNGRHPIAEQTLTTSYIPFTTTLAAPGPLAQLITGPNMGGKSSYVRAVALLVLLAQVGSFVPADALELTLTDAIHTRMGAHDNLFAGESTFMVEVSETAQILRAATPRSLVILDELGRGTSTHDGAAIAQAVLQQVVEENKCLTLFITHYQNLSRVADSLEGRIRNVHMRFEATKSGRVMDDSAMEDTDEASSGLDEEITFLYEVADGVAHRSYGLKCGKTCTHPKESDGCGSEEVEGARERSRKAQVEWNSAVACRGATIQWGWPA
ncbi:hypothetical protein PG994_011355 [Apiospora phragmitis]|uniref:MutS protein homolog 3 n=1 Tax=Apiospora phragmitis TaxID=2905665 RepID=A0ABR1TUU4_9PEZI